MASLLSVSSITLHLDCAIVRNKAYTNAHARRNVNDPNIRHSCWNLGISLVGAQRPQTSGY